MSVPLSTEDQTAVAELAKLNLEIDLLRRERKFFWLKLPALTTAVAVAGILFTAWQFQRTEQARIENDKKERTAKLQSQIRTDKQQLFDFESDPKITPTQVRFVLDDLKSLFEQLAPGDQAKEEQRVAEHIDQLVWDFPFDQKRHFDFDAATLRRWERNRKFWESNTPSHHDFLTKKYYSKIEQHRPCFENLHGFESKDYKNLPKTCDAQLIGTLIYGLIERLKIAKDSSETVLDNEIRSFVTVSNNPLLGEELRTLARLAK